MADKKATPIETTQDPDVPVAQEPQQAEPEATPTRPEPRLARRTWYREPRTERTN